MKFLAVILPTGISTFPCQHFLAPAVPVSSTVLFVEQTPPAAEWHRNNLAGKDACAVAQPGKIPSQGQPVEMPLCCSPGCWQGWKGLYSLACGSGEHHCCWQVEDTVWLTPSFEGFCLIKDLAFTLASQGFPRSLSEMSQSMVSRDEGGICCKQAPQLWCVPGLDNQILRLCRDISAWLGWYLAFRIWKANLTVNDVWSWSLALKELLLLIILFIFVVWYYTSYNRMYNIILAYLHIYVQIDICLYQLIYKCF